MNSFSTDPALQIQVKINNFIFQTVLQFLMLRFFLNNFIFKYVKNPLQSSWTDPSIVGVNGFPTYNKQPVIQVTPTLNAFQGFMEIRNLPRT